MDVSYQSFPDARDVGPNVRGHDVELSETRHAEKLKVVEMYVAACRERQVQPDGGVIICLQTGIPEICPDQELTNLQLLAVADILPKVSWVSSLVLSGQPVGDTGVALLATDVLPECRHITRLELKKARITSSGAILLASNLHLTNLSELNLSGNWFFDHCRALKVAEALRGAIQSTSTLRNLDLSRCGLTEQMMRTVQAALLPRTQHGYCACTIDFSGNFLVIELGNCISHGIGLVIAIACTAVLLTHMVTLSLAASLAVIVYMASLIMMFLNSTLYHSFFYLVSTHFVFQVLDHAGIYILIAGSYTPVLVLGCSCASSALIFLLVVAYWLTAFVGVALVTIAPWPKPAWYTRASLVLYVVMGVAGVPFFFLPGCDHIWHLIGWFATGGASFLCGVPFFVSSSDRPTFHIFWHVFVMAGCFLMLVGVWNLATSPAPACT